jgi:spermidine synthase
MQRRRVPATVGAVDAPAEPAGSAAGGREAPPGAIYLLFLLSGLAALVYQVMWTRSFGLVFGSTTRAAAAVLAAFFTGLALGSWLGGRLAAGRTASLRRYGIAELAIAGGALLVAAWLALFRAAYPALYASPVGSGAGLVVCQLLLAFVALAPPCVAMGTTLPLITRALVTSPAHFGRRVAGAYALNTLGATSGAVLAGFVLPAHVGVLRSVWAAAAVNVAVGAASLLLARRGLAEPAVSPPAADPARVATATGRTDPALRVVAAISGFGTLALEVLYTRLLGVRSDGSIFAFALVLASFLVFLAVASLLVSVTVDAVARPWRLLAVTQALAAGAILLSPGLLALHPPPRMSSALVPYLLQQLSAAALLLAPTLLLVGVALPVAWKIATRAAAEAGQRVGGLTAWNTLAGVAGSLTAGFVLLPGVGAGRGVALVAVLYAALAALAAFRGFGRRGAALACAILAAGLAALGARQPWTVSSVEVGEDARLVRAIEGESALVAVIEASNGTRSLWLNNNYLLGSDGPTATALQRAQGGLPLLLHGDPRRVAFIGVATGGSVSAIRSFPVQRALALELVPGVLEAAADLEDAHRGVLRDPRVELRVADGRNHLWATRERFDAIVGDLFVPYQPGTGYLYTAEHFRNVRARLAPGGLFAQWLPGYQMSEAELRIVTATFLDVFPDASLWLYGAVRRRPLVALVGMAEGSGPPAPAARQRAEGSAEFPFLSFVCGAGPLGAWAGDAPRNSDEQPRLELRAALDRFGAGRNARELRRVLALLERGA